MVFCILSSTNCCTRALMSLLLLASSWNTRHVTLAQLAQHFEANGGSYRAGPFARISLHVSSAVHPEGSAVPQKTVERRTKYDQSASSRCHRNANSDQSSCQCPLGCVTNVLRPKRVKNNVSLTRQQRTADLQVPISDRRRSDVSCPLTNFSFCSHLLRPAHRPASTNKVTVCCDVVPVERTGSPNKQGLSAPSTAFSGVELWIKRTR